MKKLSKIEYTKKSKITLTADNVSQEARENIESAGRDDDLVLRVSINSPVFIEAAEPLTTEGIKKVCASRIENKFSRY